MAAPETRPFSALRAEQGEWLRGAASRPESRDAAYKAVFCHTPLRWIDEIPADHDDGKYDWLNRMSRDAWHEALGQQGAPIIVSSHTHLPAWLPPSAEFPYAELIPAGPAEDPVSLEAAT